MKNIRILLSLTFLFLSLDIFATIVQKVDQGITNESKIWSYQIEEAGNYQIGLAWIEVTSGDSAVLEIFRNEERIFACYALRDTVIRFPLMIENLSIGDEIVVRADPKGSSYRLGFELAFATPDFEGLPVFEVESYGAFGNGQFDDWNAIRNAVNAAKFAGGGIVRFDGSKSYRAIGQQNMDKEELFSLQNTQNIKIEGNGANIILHPPDRLTIIEGSENIQIEGLVVDYSPLPYYQGLILSADDQNFTIDIEVPERYEVPDIGDYNENQQFGRIFIPDAPGSRAGSGNHFYIKSVESLDNTGRKLRINARDNTKNVITKAATTATEVIVPHRIYGHTANFSVMVLQSSRVELKDIRFNCVAHFGILPKDNYGPVAFSNVDILTPDPETELFVSWRDFFHVKNNRFGLLIENGNYDGGCMYDDLFNLSTHMMEVLSVSGNNLSLRRYGVPPQTWRPGDWISLWSKDMSVFRGMARQTSAEITAQSNYNIQLENEIPGIQMGDVAVNEETLQRRTIVRNCTTTMIGAGEASARLRTPTNFIGNHFENVFLWPHIMLPYVEGPKPRNFLFEDNYISGGGNPFTILNSSNFIIKSCVIEGYVICKKNSEKIIFDNVSWINLPDDMLKVFDNSTAYVLDGCTRNGSQEDLYLWGQEEQGSKIYYYAPSGYPRKIPPESDNWVGNNSGFSDHSNEIKVFPNPVRGLFTIQIPDEIEDGNIQLVDMNGRIVLSKLVRSNKIIVSTSGIEKGVYILTITNSNKMYSTKMIIILNTD